MPDVSGQAQRAAPRVAGRLSARSAGSQTGKCDAGRRRDPTLRARRRPRSAPGARRAHTSGTGSSQRDPRFAPTVPPSRISGTSATAGVATGTWMSALLRSRGGTRPWTTVWAGPAPTGGRPTRLAPPASSWRPRLARRVGTRLTTHEAQVTSGVSEGRSSRPTGWSCMSASTSCRSPVVSALYVELGIK